jgi:Zn-finger nucleic acid-binding protein
MTCPRCSSELRPNRREGVEIDVCPQCNGIWLDRGELERLAGAENRYYGDDDDSGDDSGDDSDDDGGLFGGGRNDDDDDQRRGGRGGRGGRQGRRGGFFQNLMDNIGNFGD